MPPPGGSAGFCVERKRNSPSPLPARPHERQEFPGRVELLDAIVARVHDVDVAGGVRGEAADRPELAVARSVGAPLADECAGRAELLHDVAELVGDVHIAFGTERHRLREAQHRLGALADDRGRRVRAGGRGARTGTRFGARRRRRQQQLAGAREQGGEDEQDMDPRASPDVGHRQSRLGDAIRPMDGCSQPRNRVRSRNSQAGGADAELTGSEARACRPARAGGTVAVKAGTLARTGPASCAGRLRSSRTMYSGRCLTSS